MKGKRIMRKIIARTIIVVVVFAAITALAGCGSDEEGEVADSPEKAVSMSFDALSKGDFEAARKTMNYDEMTQTAGLNMVDEGLSQQHSDRFMKALFSNLKYEITESIEQKDGSYIVKAEVINADMTDKYPEWILEVIGIGIENMDSESEGKKEDVNLKILEVFEKLIQDAVKDENVYEKTVEIKVIKDKSHWTVSGDEEITDAITGGMITAQKDFS